MRRFPFVAASALAALVMAVPLASAQGRHRGNEGGAQTQRWPSRADAGSSSSGGAERPRTERQAQPREERRPPQQQPQQRTEQGDNGRREAATRRQPPQTFVQRDDANANGRTEVRGDAQAGSRDTGRYAVPRPVPVPPRYRAGDHRVYVQPRSNYYVYRYPSYHYIAPGYYGYRVVRPGYYGYGYYDPYFAGDYYWSNYAWQPRSYYAGPSWDNGLGKLRLDVDQRDAEVYIDGHYAGVVDEFDGVLQGLRLEPGRYAVQVALPGFAPLQFDVQITPGRTTTYRGSLLPE